MWPGRAPHAALPAVTRATRLIEFLVGATDAVCRPDTAHSTTSMSDPGVSSRTCKRCKHRTRDSPGYPNLPMHQGTARSMTRLAAPCGWHGWRTSTAHADPVLMLHGEPSWSFLYRRMIPILVARGASSDLPGFSRIWSLGQAHSTGRPHLLDVLDLHRVTLVVQDWGGLIGLRLAAEHPNRFSRSSSRITDYRRVTSQCQMCGGVSARRSKGSHPSMSARSFNWVADAR